MNPHCNCDPKSFPFKCERHCVKKTKRKHELCNLEADTSDSGLKYWNYWEKGLDKQQECVPENPVLDLTINKKPITIKPRNKIASRSVKARKLTWAYGVTSVCSRVDNLLLSTLKSLQKAGFEKPTLFLDGVSHEKAVSIKQAYNLEVVNRESNIKTYGNWILTLWELYIRNPNVDRYAIFQDDFTTYKNLRQYLEKVPYPDKGYLNLYTFPSNQNLVKSDEIGWFRSNQYGRGAVALVFNKDAVTTLLQQSHMVLKPQAAKKPHKSVDGAVIESFKKIGWTEYVHNPSLVQHQGEVSSMGNSKHPQAPSYRGDDFDALELLPKPKTEKVKNGWGDNVEKALTHIGITSERVEKWLGRPCGCAERKRKLNVLGNWAEKALSQTKESAKNYLEQIVN